MTKQSIEIKRLLKTCNIDMGTFGLIELQLKELEKQIIPSCLNCGSSDGITIESYRCNHCDIYL